MINFNVHSETARLKAVLIHEPGHEVENMTPATAERALYSDILNLSVASKEYSQFKGVLERFTQVFKVGEILTEVVANDDFRIALINMLADYAENPYLVEYLFELDQQELCRQIVEGIPHAKLSLTNFLKQEKYMISPLHNFFFTRDSAFTVGNTVYSGSMAKRVRQLEALLTRFLLTHYQGFEGRVEDIRDTILPQSPHFHIEGGDVLVADKDLLLIGTGSRSSTEGIDALIQLILQTQPLKHVLVQELPDEPESFIHLDMVFTFLSQDECMVYEPLILGDTRYHTVLITIDHNRIVKIEYVENLIRGLERTGRTYKPIRCGGEQSILQEREQWHSGANFLAIDHGKVIGYERNVHTAEELSRHGYEVITARRVLREQIDLEKTSKTLITIEGSELSRGGGGARCMSMPLWRE